MKWNCMSQRVVGREADAHEAAGFGDVATCRGRWPRRKYSSATRDVAEAVVGDRLVAVLQRADVQMVLQVRADAGQVVRDADAERAQLIGRADAGQHQQLRRVDRAAAEDHFARLGARQAAAMAIVDADARARRSMQHALRPARRCARCRFARSRAGSQVAAAAEQRAPSLCVTWYRPKPCCCGPLKSSLRGWPLASRHRRTPATAVA